jgi:putative flippase GtrA
MKTLILYFIDKLRGNHPKTFYRFCLVGVLNTLIDFAAFILFYYFFHIALILSNIIAFALATLNSYFLNKYWTFRITAHKSSLKEFLTFIAVALTGLFISCVVLYLASQFIPEYLAKMIAIIFSLTCNYLGSKFLVFRKNL